MAKKPQLKKPLPLQRVREDVEVEAGIFDSRITILEDGGYQPEILLWVIVEGPILGNELGKTGELIHRAGPLIRESFKELPFLPGTLRVASEELARVLRPEISSRIQLICAPTPHLDQVANELRGFMSRGDNNFLSRGAEKENVAGFCRVAAKLYRAQPWRHIGAEDGLIGIDIPHFGIENWVLSVMGGGGESFGWLLCAGLEELEAFFAINEALAEEWDAEEESEEPSWPQFLALNFDHRTDLSPPLARELSLHGWEVAGPQAYPWLVTVDENQELRGPAPLDLEIAEAVSLALTQLVAKPKALRDAMSGKTPAFVQAQRVRLTNGQELDIQLTYPHEDDDIEMLRPEHPLLAGLFDLEDEEEIDDRRRKDLEEKLVAEFLSSAAGQGFDDLDRVRLILDLLALEFEITLPSIDTEVLHHVFGSLLPRQNDLGVGSAEEIVRQCTAFFAFLAEDCSYAPAEDCLRWLASKQARDLLRSALTQPNRFKSGPPSSPRPAEPVPPPFPLPATAAAPEETDEVQPRNPTPAERNKTKHAGPVRGSSRRRR